MPNALDIHRLLQERFGHASFREGQQEVIEAVLSGRDVLAVMPTGSGKSLCYQLPALVLEGVTLVVSPLIALMKDQVDGLRGRGIPATAIHSLLPPGERARRERGLREGRFRLVFLAPERLRSDRFRETLAGVPVARLAVDEVHCVSQWGHDFRPDYLRLGELRAAVGDPPVLALTATATPQVRDDVARQLRLRDPAVFLAGFERPNLTFAVERARGAAEKRRALGALLERVGGPGIVYVATRKRVEALAAHLSRRGIAVAAYHAGLPEADRVAAQEGFMSGRFTVLVATNAFGMGVDKANIRFVLHHDLPGSLEAYYQEAGRAGRDGRPAECRLLFGYADARLQEFFLDGANPPLELIREVYRAACAGDPVETGGRNTGAVATAVGLLERHGSVERGADGVLRPADPTLPPERLPLDPPALADKRRRDRDRLAAMLHYAETRQCRRQVLLGYFAARPGPAACGACDVCLGSDRRPAQPLSAEQVRIVRIALSAVARLDDRFGPARIAQVLVGSRAAPVRHHRLDRIPTHGLLRGLPAPGVAELLDALVDTGLLRRRGIRDGRTAGGAVLSLTAEGSRIMRDAAAALALSWPHSLQQDSRLPRAAAATRGRPPGSARDQAPLFEALRDLRGRRATVEGVPPYLVFHDRVLRAIAAARPGTIEDLARVAGVGPAKIARYGGDVLEVIRRHHEG